MYYYNNSTTWAAFEDELQKIASVAGVNKEAQLGAILRGAKGIAGKLVPGGLSAGRMAQIAAKPSIGAAKALPTGFKAIKQYGKRGLAGRGAAQAAGQAAARPMRASFGVV